MCNFISCYGRDKYRLMPRVLYRPKCVYKINFIQNFQYSLSLLHSQHTDCRLQPSSALLTYRLINMQLLCLVLFISLSVCRTVHIHHRGQHCKIMPRSCAVLPEGTMLHNFSALFLTVSVCFVISRNNHIQILTAAEDNIEK